MRTNLQLGVSLLLYIMDQPEPKLKTDTVKMILKLALMILGLEDIAREEANNAFTDIAEEMQLFQERVKNE